jgi:mannose-1-phosphate guanylyltransferase/mannose-6-phosphate isomerase
MIVVIIAGGSGTRLWPLSTSDYPKHLLQVNGDSRSLLQYAYERARQLTEQVYVISEAGHVQHVKDQLPELPAEAFIVEPGRRGTANCILAALVQIDRQHSADEAIAFIHSDHYIRDLKGFAHSFRLAEKITKQQRRIVLIGVEPTEPATSFGYIEKGEVLAGQDFVFNVRSFKEKPDRQTAKDYLKSGNYLWNGGYFVGSVDTFRDAMRKHASELYANYQKLLAAPPDQSEPVYLAFTSEAIDYALIEKVPDLLVVPASFDWMDLGSFSDLAKAVGGDEHGNHIQGKVELEEVTNSFVQNQETKPVAVVGLDNVVVVNTPDGLLVARKDLSQKIGVISKRLNEQA